MAAEPADKKTWFGLPTFGIFGLFGGIATVIGFQADIMPDLAVLDVQGILPPAFEVTDSKVSLVNMSDRQVDDVEVEIRQSGRTLHTATFSSIQMGGHRETLAPAITRSEPVSVCVRYTEAFWAWSIQSWGEWHLEAEETSYSSSPGFQPVQRQDPSLIDRFLKEPC